MACNNPKDPQYTANCDSALGQRIKIPNFCAKIEDLGRTDRENACNRLGIAGEYGNENRGDGCTFKTGTVNGCSSGGIAGQGVSCERIAFKGDPGWCCTVGLGPTGANSPCFVNGDQSQGTCPPDARSAEGQGCMDFYLPPVDPLLIPVPIFAENGFPIGFDWVPQEGYCDPSDFNTFKQRWDSKAGATDNYCYRALRINADNGKVDNVRALGEVMLKNYFSRYTLSAPGQVGYNEFQDNVLDLCKRYPGACNEYLRNNLCTDYTRENVLDFPQRQSFCGCHLRQNQYETNLNEKAGVSRECDTICIPERTVKVVDSFGKLQLCQNTICAIDNVTINLINSEAGNISFSQVCGENCKGSCSCVFQDINISGQNSQIGDINFGQDCAQKTCYVTSDIDGGLIEVDCEAPESERETRRNDASDRNPTEGSRSSAIIFIIIGVIIFILLVVLLIFLLK